MFTNIRSVLKNREPLSAVIDSCSADVIVLTETWLSNKIRDSEILECKKKYKIYRYDRDVRSGGGVLIAVDSSIASSSVQVTSNIEITWVTLELKDRKIVIGACYRPPSSDHSFVNNLHDVVNLISVRFPKSPILLLGDFNYPSITWTVDGPVSGDRASEPQLFVDFCSEFHFTQMVTQPTRCTAHSANTLDLVLTSSPDAVTSMSVLPGISDHSLIHFSLTFPVSRLKKHVKYIRDYAKADYDSINAELSYFVDEFLEQFTNRSVEENWNHFKTKVLELTDKHIPMRAIKNNRAPWYNKTLSKLANKKKRTFRAVKRTHQPERWRAYRRANFNYIRAVREAKDFFFKRTLPSMLRTNPRQFWRVMGGGKEDDISISPVDGDTLPASQCCTAFNEFFSKSFSVSDCSFDANVSDSEFCSMSPIVIDPAGVSRVIDTLKLSSASGVDNINSKFLKNTKTYSSIILTKIFQQSLECGILPRDWKIGKVIPVHKSGCKQHINNFRPISLTCISCKILEHIISSQIAAHLDGHSFFHRSQHGFRKHYSCETQLACFTHSLHSILDRGAVVDCIFLDFSKAFDKVSHKLLLLKLSKLNLDTSVLAWLRCFLTNRFQFVTVNHFDSSLSPVLSGVPQGSVLGPLLFLIYINDLPSRVHSSINLFADDCVIYREIRNANDSLALQSDLNAVSSWCSEWVMTLNINKCKVMHVSRTSAPSSTYTLQQHTLDIVSSYKYLGVHISNNLSWDQHVTYVSNSANRLLGYLKRNFSSISSSLKLLLYKTLIRPKLEYAASIWDPHQEFLVTGVEAIQNRSARFILSNYHRTASVSYMKSTLFLPNLSLRRKILRLSLFHKIYFHAHLHNFLLSAPSYISRRVDHRYKVAPFTCKTNAFYHSFFPHTVNEWNRLPETLVSIQDNKLFKAALLAHFSDFS